ncbi:MarR family winged helix-turn-helix transcriptional regulator [Promicromonospora panici]|uniref:MarR family winged helix-turn-helix transcriptional regulator n=1 Tax=Promicromonospora panici TaxID=2219658 RepID=UPI001A9258FA|nr:MarR family transcriptional regulator [Promicromonospora panici]
MRFDKMISGLPACGARGLGGLPDVVELAIVLTATIARVAEEHELTPMQGRLLCGLAGQPRRMIDLAQSLGVEKAALTGLVDRAERRGLVERVTLPGDRRVVQVTLTDAGTQAMLDFEAGLASALDELLAPLPAKDRSALRGMAAAVVGAARAA